MHWAKTSSRARFNLATSGLANRPMKDLGVSIDDLEITGGGYGYPPLIDALAERYDVDSKCIVTAEGTSFANHLAMAALINPGEEVLIETPVYEPLLALARYLGAQIKRFTRSFDHEFQLSPEGISSRLSDNTRLIVLSNLHNPTGVLSEDDPLRKVGELARAVNAHVLVDEVYLEMLFESRPRTAFHLGNEFVVTSSLTKTFGLSGLRCGWIFAEPALVERMWRLDDLFAATPVHAAERLSVVALKKIATLGQWAKSRFDTNRQLLNEFLDTRNDLQTVRPASGSIMFPRVKAGSADELLKLLRDKYDTSVVPGSFFDMPAHFRIGLGGETEEMAEGLRRLGLALDEIKSSEYATQRLHPIGR
jgi:aspartate/methionine/tyrosine aminotransferase